MNKDIAKELNQMGEEDQKMRRSGDWDDNVDKRNTLELKKILKKIGWPSRKKVGDEASNYAWLIAQHADHDVEFQKECFELMSKEPKEDIWIQNLAYLEDRINVNTGKPQRFGTQFYTDENQVFGPRKIADMKQMYELRKQYKIIPSFKEYKKRMEEMNKEWLEKQK